MIDCITPSAIGGTTSHYVELLQISDGKDISKIGGKAASLYKLIDAGFCVPPGFVLLSSGFSYFLENTGLDQVISEILKRIDGSYEGFTICANQIADLFVMAEIPDNLSKELLGQFDALKSKNVTVRSSAIGEDGPQFSWAGRLDTLLNVSRADLESSVKLCWASLYSARALFYMWKNGIEFNDVSMAVVVQEMVTGEKSGVGFSAHPVTGDHNKILVEATKGLGEELVSGFITPDKYVITKKEDIDYSVYEGTVLRDCELEKLVKTIQLIEETYGFPVDVEWSFFNNSLFILQARPITTIRGEHLS